MLLSGTKKEEYREIKYYYVQRLASAYEAQIKDGRRHVWFENSKLIKFDAIEFSNGYGKKVPKATFEHLGTCTGIGKPDWGAPENDCFILQVGKLIKTDNLK